MKSLTAQLARKIICAAAVAALLTGCGAPQTAFSPSGSASTNVSRHVGPLDDPSTQVDIQNDWTAAIAGSGSATCWTISPPLPVVGAGDTAGPITLTYTPLCPSISTLPITYGPAISTGPSCTFDVSYTSSGFSYSVTQSALTDCRIVYPPNGVNAIFVYNQLGSGAKRAVRSPLMH
jgi:hypothetical protein